MALFLLLHYPNTLTAGLLANIDLPVQY